MVKYNDHPLYCFLSPEEKKLLQPIVKSQSFMAHETIINLGERNRDIICLEEGSVSIQVEDFELFVWWWWQKKNSCLFGW